MVDAPKLLIVEDEPELREILAYNFAREGFAVATSGDGHESLQLAQRERPEVILLDLLLPGLDGWELCRLLRAARRPAPVHIVIASALDREDDVLRGLELGADDYIRKPFRVREVVARIRAVLRRSPARSPAEPAGEILESSPLALHLAAHEARLGGVPLCLTATEYRLLCFLMRQPGRIFTRQQLLAHVFDHRHGGSGRNIDVHIRSLRRKLGEHAALLDTARGVGYRFRPAAHAFADARSARATRHVTGI